MLAEIASTKACERIRGQFRPLRAPERASTVTGVLWLRECKVANQGTRATFQLGGVGWQWAEETEEKAGAAFEVRQYIRFAIAVSITGTIDTTYDPGTHVASLRFTPVRPPEAKFTPVGGIEVDEQGAWASIVGALGSVLARSPEAQAKEEAAGKGVAQLEKQFGAGVSVTVDLCTGLSRFGMGRPEEATMGPPDVSETHDIPTELQTGGLIVFGPYLAPDGMTATLRPRQGAVEATLMCHDDAEALALAYFEGRRPPRVRRLATATAGGNAGTELRAKRATCPVALVARPASSGPPVRFDWKRPTREAARATGGPLIDCGKRAPAL